MVDNFYHWQRSNTPVNPSAPTIVPKLQSIATANITVALWNHISIPEALPESIKYYGTKVKATFEWAELIKKVRDSTEKLPVPYPVSENIKECVSIVGGRIDDWVRYHVQTIFFSSANEKLLYYHVPYFAWYPDGTINYEQTARNLVPSLRLSFVEKYKLLCTYCLKDEISEMVPLMRLNNLKVVVDFESHPLIYYWNCFFTNRLHTIPVVGNVSVDSFMFQYTGVDNWPAKRYFFDRLSSQEKIRNTIQLIDTRGIDYQSLVFTKLSQVERVHVYRQRAQAIMINYLKLGSNKCSLLRVAWIDMRSLIIAEQFSPIFYSLLKSFHDVTNTLYYTPVQVNSLRAENRNLGLVLQEMWETTSDEFRNHLIEYNDCEIINKMFELSMKNIIDNNLLFSVLSDVNVCKNEKIFYSLLKSFHDETNTLYNTPDQLNSLRAQNRNLSFVLQKMWEMTSDDFRNHLIELNDCEIIDKIFELSMKNIIDDNLLFTVLSNVNVYKTEKIFSLPIFNSYYDKLLANDDLHAFDRLLNMFLPLDQNPAQFREHFVFHSAYVRNECLRLYSLGHVNPVNGILSKLLPTTYHTVVSEFKTNLLLSPDGIIQCVQNGILNLDENTMNAVMADALLYADLITEFKRNLVTSPSAIKVFQELILNNRLTGVFYYIDNYLTSDEERSMLKKRLLAFDDLATAMVTIFSKYDDVWIRNLLEWCAEDDKKGREFRLTLPIDDIFNRLLKQAVFSHYDDVDHVLVLSKCVFRDAGSFKVEIQAMNRFLNWYFEFDSYNDIKEYKLRRIHSYTLTIYTWTTIFIVADEAEVIEVLDREHREFSCARRNPTHPRTFQSR
ncbi:uncharacterized protein LOC135849080 [Planococcus citri]|uniref:uncharacterized protein LOC135849080 n=1 Tax=Planococcus citri TaxID=170843 RepID=UPI0031F7CC53